MPGGQRVGREDILACAGALLGAGRLGELTVEALARTLRMSRSTLYKFFESKEDILVALVSEACQQTDADLGALMALPEPRDRLEALARVIGAHGQRLPRAVLLEPSSLPETCSERLSAASTSFREAALEIVEHGANAGVFLRSDPGLIAVAYVSAAEAVLLDGARLGIERYGERVEELPRLLLPGILSPLLDTPA